MYKVFANRLPIVITADKMYLDNPNTYLLSSISIEEIIKKLKIKKKIFIYSPNKDNILNEFKTKIDTIKAAGGIVRNEDNELLFIFRKGKWDLPKGKVEKNEKNKDAAIREVIEETGIKKLKIDKFFEKTFHIIKVKKKYFLKETNWYKMNSSYNGKLKPQKSEGIRSAKWKSIDQAKDIKKKTFKNISIILKKYLKEV